MSQDTDCCDGSYPDHAHDDQFCCRGERNANGNLCSRESNVCSGEPTSTSGRMCSLESKQICCPEGASDSPKASTINQVRQQCEKWLFHLSIFVNACFVQINFTISL